ncbi:hypothetical protein K431DRAFT_98759 [Polychaeton citri CBS 116435]|uniref:Uncharacterized protein n=1 Tax=Polychaeton citri CBS 116435 TaxID=1314669 RepID=A0A9P4QGI8_9PEZI|nr:hypothetical protein K431DRAFT_98759 [Polychaeton citri CBS 116435]
MRAVERNPRSTSGGRWKPPKSLGSNQSVQPELWYKYDERDPVMQNGFQSPTRRMDREVVFRPSRPQQPLPAHYKTVSMYYSGGVFWLVEYDATTEAVNDGIDIADPRMMRRGSTDEEEKPDWDPMEFRQCANLVSYACRRGTHRNLLVVRPDQMWPHRILTDVHAALSSTGNRCLGGLIGELPLLLGLVYLALRESDVVRYMPRVVQRQWSIVEQMGRNYGWREKRGVVVSVYTNPPEATSQQLECYERGGYGTMFN